MKKIIAVIVAILSITTTFAQDKYFTKSATVKFYSSTPVETIEAVNRKAVSVLDAITGNIEFSVLNMAFEFEKALMQEHFNENYMESEKFPKAIFKGKIDNFNSIDLRKDGTYPVIVSGKLTMHGITKDVTEKGTLVVKGGKISGSTVFNIVPQDYNIEIPGLVKEKIAKKIKVTVDSDYEPLKK